MIGMTATARRIDSSSTLETDSHADQTAAIAMGRPKEQDMIGAGSDDMGAPQPNGSTPDKSGTTVTLTSPVPASIDAAFGQAVWLMMNIPAYRHMFLTDLEWMVLPPIMLGQFRVFFAEGRAV